MLLLVVLNFFCNGIVILRMIYCLLFMIRHGASRVSHTTYPNNEIPFLTETSRLVLWNRSTYFIEFVDFFYGTSRHNQWNGRLIS